MFKKSFLFFLFPFLLFSFQVNEGSPTKKILPKQLKENYSIIPAGSVNVEGISQSVQTFIMSKTVVTNKEYNTFLEDLRNSGEMELYEKVKANAALWNNVLVSDNQEFGRQYHEHPAFANYPVVNVSKEGAELYCNWLTEKMNKEFSGNQKIEFRLPKKAEWYKAAYGSDSNRFYAWNGPYVRNSKGQFLANFVHVPQNWITRDGNGSFIVVPTKFDRNELENESATLLTTPAKSYFPNEFDLYNLNGNVEELLEDYDEVIGGSWRDTGRDIQNNSVKEYKEPTPTIGFRVVAIITSE